MVLLASFIAAVKVQKSNNHHWDPSSNYCHPPHGSHSKTWSSPSHPHNQQDHSKCKLSLMTAPLLARHGGGRGLFLFLSFCTFVRSFSESFTLTLAASIYSAPSSPCACATDLTAVHMANVSCLMCSAALIVWAFWYVWALCLLSALVSGGFSPSSTATSGFSSQGSNTLPCPIPPMAPTSPRSSTGKRRNRKKDHKSSCMKKVLFAN